MTTTELIRPIGHPPGPYVKPQVFIDEDGMFTVFPDKTCAVCSVGLTSRNRYGKKTLCLDHGRELDRIRRGGSTKAPKPASAPVAERAKQDPAHSRLQSMFALWCNNPVNTTHRVNLKDAMQLHELMSYMKHAIPLDPPSTPEAAPAA